MTTPARSIFLAASAIAIAIAACGGPAKTITLVHHDVVIPIQEARSLVTMTAEPTAELVAADATGKLAVRIRIQAPPLADADRPPLNLALVLDTSASMEGESIDQLKTAARAIVEHMTDRDRLAVVAFSSRSTVLLASTPMGAARRAIALKAIDEIKATGTTDLAGGIAAGMQQVLGNRKAGGIDRMVLLADGFPNDPAPIPGVVQSAAANGVAITTLGIGIEHSQEMLDVIARDTGGVYRYAPDGETIAMVFQKELLRMQTLVARNLNLRIGPGPGVNLGNAPWLTAAGRERVVNLGDLAAGETRDVIVPLEVSGHAPGLTVELLDADLSFSDAMSGSSQTRTAFVGIKASDDAAAVKASAKTDLVIGQARAEAAGAIIQAINLARGGSLDQAKKLLADAEKAARKAADKLKDAELAELAERMTELGRNLALIHVPPPVVGLEVRGVVNGTVPGGDAASYRAMTSPPSSAPPSIEPSIRATYEKAKSTLDRR